MGFHEVETSNQTLRGLRILLLVALLPAAAVCIGQAICNRIADVLRGAGVR